jgi:hypothetical protein
LSTKVKKLESAFVYWWYAITLYFWFKLRQGV